MERGPLPTEAFPLRTEYLALNSESDCSTFPGWRRFKRHLSLDKVTPTTGPSWHSPQNLCSYAGSSPAHDAALRRFGPSSIQSREDLARGPPTRRLLAPKQSKATAKAQKRIRLCSASQDPYHSFRRSGLFRIMEAIRAPLMGGLEYMGRIRILSWDSTLLASSASLQMTVKAPTRSPRDRSQVECGPLLAIPATPPRHPPCSLSCLLPWPC